MFRCCLLLSLGLLTANAAAALEDGLSTVVGAAGNVTLSSGPDGLLVVGSFDGVLDEQTLAALGSALPRLVIDTDPDDAALTAAGDGAVVLRRDGETVRAGLGAVLERDARKPFKTEAASARPIVTFAAGDSFAFNGDEVGIFRIPSGLVAGASAVLFPGAATVHLGQLLTPGEYPDIDVGHGGSISGLIAAIGRLINIAGPEARFIPARGPALDRAALIAYRDILSGIRHAMRLAMQRGDSLADIQAQKPTAAWDAEWGQGAISGAQFTAIVHESLLNPPEDD